MEHPGPTVSTIKQLYAHAVSCAFPGCSEPLYREEITAGTWTLNSRICHICARSEGGPRWDPRQSADDNRSEANLLLMCTAHASAIDDQKTLSRYPAELLREWKSQQVEEHRNLRAGWPLTSAMAENAAAASFSNVAVAINNSSIDLGGKGGSAPGAGGGGGGAIGPGARAGSGGSGGQFLDLNGRPLPSEAIEELLDQSDADASPGAGGGGAGAHGPGSIGGDGGNGGDAAFGGFEVQPGDVLDIKVGAGGQAPRLPGQHGTPGEDSVVTVKSPDGKIKRVITSKGGSGAKSGNIPDDWVTISQSDLDDGFQISTIIAANAFEVRDGLLFILGGGWSKFQVPTLPFDAVWPVLCIATWKNLSPRPTRGVQICLLDPSGQEISRIAMGVPGNLENTSCYFLPVTIGAPLDCAGPWFLRAQSGSFLLAEIQIDVEVTTP